MAEPANGNNSVVYLSREATWAAGVSATPQIEQVLVMPGTGMKGDQALLPNDLLGADPNPRDPASGRQAAAGEFSFYPNVTSLPYLNEFALGTRSTTGAGPYVHTSKLTSGALPSWIIEESVDLAAGTKYKQSKGVRVDKVSIDIADQGFLMYKCSMLGKGVTLASTSIDATVGATVLDWTSQSVFDHLQLAAADVKLNGSPFAQIVSGTLELNQNHFGDHYVAGGSAQRRSLPRRRATVGGKIKTFFEDVTAYNLALNGTFVAIDLTWTNGSVTFRLLVPRVRLKRTDPVLTNGPMELEFEVMGAKDSSETTAFETVVTNAVAGTVYDA